MKLKTPNQSNQKMYLHLDMEILYSFSMLTLTEHPLNFGSTASRNPKSSYSVTFQNEVLKSHSAKYIYIYIYGNALVFPFFSSQLLTQEGIKTYQAYTLPYLISLAKMLQMYFLNRLANGCPKIEYALAIKHVMIKNCSVPHIASL